MATRTSANTGMIITIIIFAVLAVAGFITTMVFFAAKQSAERDLRDLQAQQSEIIADAERGASNVQGYLDRADDNRQSLVGYLIAQLQRSMATAAGNPNLAHGDPADPSAWRTADIAFTYRSHWSSSALRRASPAVVSR